MVSRIDRKSPNGCLLYTSVPDFVRIFFVSCTQISKVYAMRTLMKFGCDWRKISHKSRCRKDSERTFICQFLEYGTAACFALPQSQYSHDTTIPSVLKVKSVLI